MLVSGATAPNIVAADLEGRQQSLTGFLANGPVLVAFFKISCPTCQFTFPFLQRMADAGVPIVGVSQDEPGPTQAFCDRFAVRFPVLLDRSSAGYTASNAYGITNVPTLFLVDETGTIATSSHGFSRQDLTQVGGRFGVVPFAAGESVPEFKPG
jgi:peroxiredoxin